MTPKINANKLFKTQNYFESSILKTLENELGYTAAHSVLSYISSTLGMSKQEIVSDFEKFSRVIKQVYGDSGEKYVLDKLSNLR